MKPHVSMACFIVETALLKGRDFELCNAGMYIFFEQRVWHSTPQKWTFCLTEQLCSGFCLSAEANKGWQGGHSQLVKDQEGNKTGLEPAIRKFLSCLTFYVVPYVFIRNNLDKSQLWVTECGSHSSLLLSIYVGGRLFVVWWTFWIHNLYNFLLRTSLWWQIWLVLHQMLFVVILIIYTGIVNGPEDFIGKFPINLHN